MTHSTGHWMWGVWVHVTFVLAIAIWCAVSGVLLRSEVHVSVHGRDWWLGTANWPVRTVQVGVDRVCSGGLVRIGVGRYQERVHIRRGGLEHGSPTRVEAAEPGRVVLSWRTEPFSLTDPSWSREGQYFRRRVMWPVHRVDLSGADCFRVLGGESSLGELAGRPNAFPAFTYNEGELTLFVPAEMESEAGVAWNRRVPAPREWGEFRSANLWIEADHVTLRGLELEYGMGSSVKIWKGANILVEDCVFHGATVGVDASAKFHDVSEVVVQRCLYHNYPQHHWLENWLPWKDIYAAYSSSTLVRSSASGTRVRQCVASHVGDALQVSSRGHGPVDIRIENNWLLRGTDDAIEAEGAASGVTVRRNLILDFHESLGLSPVLSGPVEVEENVCLHPQVVKNGAQIKLISPKRMEQHRIRNIHVHDNLFWGNWLCWYSLGTKCADVTVERNLFAVARENTPAFPPGVSDIDNERVVIGDDDLELSTVWNQLTAMAAERNLKFPEVPVHRTDVGPTYWDWEHHPATAGMPLDLNLSEKPQP